MLQRESRGEWGEEGWLAGKERGKVGREEEKSVNTGEEIRKN